MSGSVFAETIRRNWKAMLIWGIVIASMGVYAVVVIPDSETLRRYGEILETMPAFLINMMGGGDAAFIASPEGFLAFTFFGWIMLVFATYAVLAGLNVTANEEERGIMDILLSMPLPRWRLVLEKLAAHSLMIVGIAIISFLGIWIPVQGSPLFKVSTGRLIESTLNLIPASLLVLVFTAMIGTLVRRRNAAAAIAAAFVGISYFVDVIGRSAQVANFARTLSFYSYYDSTGVVQNGLAWGNVIGLLAVTVVMAAGSVAFFERRNIGV